MVNLTQSLRHWLYAHYPDKIALIALGHTEFYTVEMHMEYLEWCRTEEGKQYLIGGSKYKED